MKNYRQHIDDFFREKLGNYRETPPAEAWDELEIKLDGLPPSVPGTPFRWIWHAAIISLLLVLGISAARSIIGNSYTGDNENTVAQQANGNKDAIAMAQGQATNQAGNTLPGADQSVTGNNNAPGSGQNGGTGDNNEKNNTAQQQAGVHYLASRVSSQPSVTGRRAGKMNKTEATPQAGDNDNTGDKDNSSNTQPNSEEETNNTSTLAASPSSALSTGDNKPATLPGTFKKDQAIATKKEDAQMKNGGANDSSTGFRRFEAGVKAGYESGFSSGGATKFALSPYLQYNLTPKFALMTQPAVKYANVSTHDLASQTYYDAYGANTKQNSSTTPLTTTIGGSIVTYANATNYTYSETHDSTVVSKKYGGSYMELELALLLKYNISGKVSVYGGPNLVYNKFNAYTENTSGQKGIVRSITYSDTTQPNAPIQPRTDIGFTYSGIPSKDGGQLSPSNNNGQINIGYMVGFSYNYSKKWLFDALVQQAPFNTSGNSNSVPLSTTYFRLSVGYKLTK